MPDLSVQSHTCQHIIQTLYSTCCQLHNTQAAAKMTAHTDGQDGQGQTCELQLTHPPAGVAQYYRPHGFLNVTTYSGCAWSLSKTTWQ